MHTCSRPCNNDIDRAAYQEDVREAIAFIEGRDEKIQEALLQKMQDLAAQTRFEDAEVLHRRLDKIRRAASGIQRYVFCRLGFQSHRGARLGFRRQM